MLLYTIADHHMLYRCSLFQLADILSAGLTDAKAVESLLFHMFAKWIMLIHERARVYRMM